MTLLHLALRTLRHYRRSTLAVLAGLTVAAAIITGSLIVSASLSGSLRDAGLRRLGHLGPRLATPRPVRASLPLELSTALGAQDAASARVCGLLHTTGTAGRADSAARVPEVTIVGVDESFRRLQAPFFDRVRGDALVINAVLARDLGARVGDEIIISLHRPQEIGLDSLFARRRLADVVATLQLPMAAVLPDDGPGDLRPDSQSARPRNVFLPRDLLERTLGLPGPNLLMAEAGLPVASLQQALNERLTLEDLGLSLKLKPRSVSLRSAALTLTEDEVTAIQQLAATQAATTRLVSMYLATALVAPSGKRLAYSTVAGVSSPEGLAVTPARSQLRADEIILNAWAAQDLQAKPGDPLTVEYLVPTAGGEYRTGRLTLRLAGIAAMQGLAVDMDLMPEYEGLTDALTLGDWKPPFPVDLRRITPRDEEYWERYRATPKAFVGLEVAERMWRSGPNSAAAYVTSAEVTPGRAADLGELIRQFRAQLPAQLAQKNLSFQFRDARAETIAAAQGTTDFSQLFLGLSMFIIAAGLGLGALLLRVGVERRARQIGLLLAVGVPHARVQRLLLSEGLLLSALGALLGLPVGLLYAWSMLRALALWWRGALGAVPALWLHAPPGQLLIGVVSSFLVAAVTVWLTTRGLARLDPVELWRPEGQRRSWARHHERRRGAGWALLLAGLAIVLLALALGTSLLPPVPTFFAIGILVMVSGLLALRARMMAPPSPEPLRSLRQLGWRNSGLHPGRSLLTAGLVAGATFVIVATAANLRDVRLADVFDRTSGTGGFNLVATASVPLPFDPATADGRSRLGLAADEPLLSRCEIISLLQSPGDDLSCLNAASPGRPRLLGVSPALIARGGFRFADRHTRWEDLQRVETPPPAFGDADTVLWRLHRQPGQEYEGLRLRGLLVRSLFAGHLLVSEQTLRRLYPQVSAPSFFLIRTAPEDEARVLEALRSRQGDLGLQVRPSRELLAEFLQVQNVYISMFLALGGLGLLLGTVGLAAVTARNVLERRAELALLAATGFTTRKLTRLLLVEHLGLLAAGLLLGASAALLAMAPALSAPEAGMNWPTLAASLLTVLLAGLLTNLLAVRMTLTENPIASLRHE